MKSWILSALLDAIKAAYHAMVGLLVADQAHVTHTSLGAAFSVAGLAAAASIVLDLKSAPISAADKQAVLGVVSTLSPALDATVGATSDPTLPPAAPAPAPAPVAPAPPVA